MTPSAFRQLVHIAVIGGALSACGVHESPREAFGRIPDVELPDAELAEVLISDDPEIAAAMIAAYPEADPAYAVFKLPDERLVRPILLSRLRGHYALVTGTTDPYNCHACPGSISIDYLAKTASGAFAVEKRFPSALEGTGWGQVGALMEIQIAPGRMGFMQTAEDMGQGIITKSADVVEFTQSGPRILLKDEAWGYDTAGAVLDKKVVIEARIVPAPENATLAVRFTGRSIDGERGQLIDQLVVWREANGSLQSDVKNPIE